MGKNPNSEDAEYYKTTSDEATKIDIARPEYRKRMAIADYEAAKYGITIPAHKRERKKYKDLYDKYKYRPLR